MVGGLVGNIAVLAVMLSDKRSGNREVWRTNMFLVSLAVSPPTQHHHISPNNPINPINPIYPIYPINPINPSILSVSRWPIFCS